MLILLITDILSVAEIDVPAHGLLKQPRYGIRYEFTELTLGKPYLPTLVDFLIRLLEFIVTLPEILVVIKGPSNGLPD